MKYDRFQFTDLYPIILARKIIVLADKRNTALNQSVTISLIDFYQSYKLIAHLEDELLHEVFEIFDSITEQLNDVFTLVTETKYTPPINKEVAIDYYNNFLECQLKFLKSGNGYAEDLYGKKQFIKDFFIIKESGLKIFRVEFNLKELIDACKKYFEDYFKIQAKMYEFVKSSIPGNAPSIEKQGELFIQQIKERRSILGIQKVNVGMRDWGMRMSMFFVKGEPILHPLNMDYKQKSILPLYLEYKGLLDIDDFSLINGPTDNSEIDIQYSVSIPCVHNVFESDTGFIPLDIRMTLNESQIVILEKIYEELNESLIFLNKPNLKKSFTDLSIWFIKRLVYCLEEETFLRNRVLDYLENNLENNYIQMEDHFFLPFIYERLLDSFGSNRVLKKAKKIKGEIDLLFDSTIPIELKVWRKKPKELTINSVDEEFPHLLQASAYATINRIAFLIILDISNPNNEITNLENCWKILTKEFDISKNLNTKVVTLIFNCNYTSPSKLN